MALITWNDKYLLGISTFDQHHRNLIDHINNVYNCFEDPSYERIKKILDELTKYAKYHFEAEENWMQGIAYPDYYCHANEHQKFFVKIDSLVSELDSAKQGVLSDLSQFLKHWLVDHIMKTDFKYNLYYSSLKND